MKKQTWFKYRILLDGEKNERVVVVPKKRLILWILLIAIMHVGPMKRAIKWL